MSGCLVKYRDDFTFLNLKEDDMMLDAIQMDKFSES
jgi:hypothetical protein